MGFDKNEPGESYLDFFLQCFSLYPLESNLFFREEEKNDPEHFYSLSKYTLTQAAASILLV